MTADLEAKQANLGGRARIELQLSKQWIAVAGITAENTTINGRNITYGFPAAGGITTLANIDRSFLNVAPEFSLLYLPNTKWQFRGRVATGYATPAASNLTITSAGVPDNHGQPQTQENLGFDVGAD